MAKETKTQSTSAADLAARYLQENPHIDSVLITDEEPPIVFLGDIQGKNAADNHCIKNGSSHKTFTRE